MNDKLFCTLQYLVPQHGLSRAAGRLAGTRNKTVKNTFIRWFIRRYGVDMTQAAEENPEHYACFNDFFTRALKPGARPICDQPEAIACPADGAISQLGSIEQDRIFQAKGRDYSALELLGGDRALADEFSDGQFATIYLSPKDYHRVHMPRSGTLRRTLAIPGDLFSVNTATAGQVPRLFARNERLVAIFDTDLGPMAVVMVGAMIVAGIETVWGGEQPVARRDITTTDYTSHDVRLHKGEEMGRFKLGSTVVLLFGKDAVTWEPRFTAGSATVMGEKLGEQLATSR